VRLLADQGLVIDEYGAPTTDLLADKGEPAL
jgi:hypothetical protein